MAPEPPQCKCEDSCMIFGDGNHTLSSQREWPVPLRTGAICAGPLGISISKYQRVHSQQPSLSLSLLLLSDTRCLTHCWELTLASSFKKALKPQ